jgi:hypothetical protein
VIVDLGAGGHGRPGVAGGASLLDRDRRADPLEEVEGGFLHPLQELAGVGGEALHVAALALGVERVEGEAALARPRHPRHHHELAGGHGDVDSLQVVDADSPSDDFRRHGNP